MVWGRLIVDVHLWRGGYVKVNHGVLHQYRDTGIWNTKEYLEIFLCILEIDRTDWMVNGDYVDNTQIKE